MQVTVTVIGNVVEGPKLEVTRGGRKVACFLVASTSRRYDAGSATWTVGETLYLRVKCWGGLAQSVASTIRAGAPVIVQGRLTGRTGVTDGRHGDRRNYSEVVASAVGLDLARTAVPASSARGEEQQAMSMSA